MSETDSIVPPSIDTLDGILRRFNDRVESVELTYEVNGITKRQKVVLREEKLRE